jgi:hypothetical protein
MIKSIYSASYEIEGHFAWHFPALPAALIGPGFLIRVKADNTLLSQEEVVEIPVPPD